MREPSPWIAVLISIIAIFVSSASLYYNVYYDSEDIGVRLLGYDQELLPAPPPPPGESRVRETIGIISKTAFINSGNRDVLVTDVFMQFRINGADAGGTTSVKANVNERTDPILLPPKSVRQVEHRFGLMQARSEAIKTNRKSVEVGLNLVVSTIGPTGVLKKTEINAGGVRYVDGRMQSVWTQSKLEKVR